MTLPQGNEKSKINNILRFHEKSVLGGNGPWDYEPNFELFSQKIVRTTTNYEIHLKCRESSGSILTGFRCPKLCSLALDKSPAFKKFCVPENVQYKKLGTSLLKKNPFYLEDDNHKVVFFCWNLIFPLISIKR